MKVLSVSHAACLYLPVTKLACAVDSVIRKEPADHVHDTCPNRFAYEPLFYEGTYIYKKSEHNCRWCGVKSPDHLAEDCHHKKYAAHQEALGVKNLRSPCRFCNERNPSHSPINCPNQRIYLAFKADYVWNALTPEARDFINSIPTPVSSVDGVDYMDAFSLLVSDVIIQDQLGAMLGYGAHNKEIVEATWMSGYLLTNPQYFVNPRDAFESYHYDDSKYAEVDCLGRPDLTMLIDINDDAERQQLLIDRPELNDYPTEIPDNDRTPRNLTSGNVTDVDMSLVRPNPAAGDGVRSFKPNCPLGRLSFLEAGGRGCAHRGRAYIRRR